MKYVYKFLELLLVILVIAFAVSYYYKDKLISIPNVHPATLKDPIQKTVTSSYKINFKNYNYTYEVTPVADYKITGVVVSKSDYNQPNDDPEKVVRFDICMVWGKNVSDNIYLSPNISFSQNQRLCNYKFSGDVGLHEDQISNNCIVTTNSSIIDKIQSINIGDEISITGQLVNLSASGSANEYSSLKSYNWSTSTDRKDTGARAYEMIYVESIDILTSAHETGIKVNTYSLWAIGGIIALFILRAMVIILFLKPKRNSGLIR